MPYQGRASATWERASRKVLLRREFQCIFVIPAIACHSEGLDDLGHHTSVRQSGTEAPRHTQTTVIAELNSDSRRNKENAYVNNQSDYSR